MLSKKLVHLILPSLSLPSFLVLRNSRRSQNHHLHSLRLHSLTFPQQKYSLSSPFIIHYLSLGTFLFKKQADPNEPTTPPPFNLFGDDPSAKSLFRFDPNKLSLTRKYLDSKKLQNYQKAFYEDTADPKKAYYYLRVPFHLIHQTLKSSSKGIESPEKL